MRSFAVLLLLMMGVAEAQSNDPGRPNRPDKPLPPGLERQVERNIQRAISQIDKVAARAAQQSNHRLEAISQKLMKQQEQPTLPHNGQPDRLTLTEQRLDRRDLAHEPAIKREWVILLPSAKFEQLTKSRASWLQYITETEVIDVLDEHLVTLTVPQELDELSALAKILPAEILALTSRNYLFSANQTTASTKESPAAWRFSQPLCATPAKYGLADSLINTEHMAFARKPAIVQQSFIRNPEPTDQAHATAIASILVGESAHNQPLLQQAELFNAAVLTADAQQSQASLASLLQGINWLVGQHVKVMNLSLSGPDNPLLQKMIAAVVAKQIIVVAAVGNEGPASPVRYPAGYEEVIAVTAVDSQYHPYRWAVTGDHIDFAAPGVNLYAASAKAWGTVTGTSFSSPIVAAYIACLPNLANLKGSEVKQLLQQQANAATGTTLPYPLLIPRSQ